MVKIEKLQLKVNGYNEFSNKEKLKLPKKVGKKTEEEILDSLFSKWVEKDVSFNSSKDTLHPNLIRYLIRKNICKIKREDRNKDNSWCYLENNKKQRINISKQIYFGYQFVEKLREYRSESHIKHFFDKNGYLTNLKLEEWVRSWNGAKTTRRLDFVFDIGNEKKIVIEYLEKHHLEEYRNWSNYQTIRLVDILFGPNKDDIIHFAFIWDHLMDDNYLNKKVESFCETCKNHFDIENEEKYVISILNENIDNIALSKLLFDAYKNKNKPILRLKSTINELFNIKEDKYDYLKNKFIEYVKLKQDLDGGMEPFNSDSDNDNENSLDIVVKEKKIYYEENDDEILLSNNGLSQYLDILGIDYFYKMKDYFYKVEFMDSISDSAYNSANKIRDLIINQKENLISGLKDIDD